MFSSSFPFFLLVLLVFFPLVSQKAALQLFFELFFFCVHFSLVLFQNFYSSHLLLTSLQLSMFSSSFPFFVLVPPVFFPLVSQKAASFPRCFSKFLLLPPRTNFPPASHLISSMFSSSFPFVLVLL